MFVQVDYATGGADDLLAYMAQSRGDQAPDQAQAQDGDPESSEVKLRTPSGRPATDAEREAFIERSEQFDIHRQLILSPANGDDLSREEFEQATRETLREWTADRPTARYLYAIHEDTDHRHAHAAVTGRRSDLEMDREDIDELRDEIAREQYREEEFEQEAVQDREVSQAQASSVPQSTPRVATGAELGRVTERAAGLVQRTNEPSTSASQEPASTAARDSGTEWEREDEDVLEDDQEEPEYRALREALEDDQADEQTQQQ